MKQKLLEIGFLTGHDGIPEEIRSVTSLQNDVGFIEQKDTAPPLGQPKDHLKAHLNLMGGSTNVG